MDRADVRPAVEIRSRTSGLRMERRLRPAEYGALLYVYRVGNRTMAAAKFEAEAAARGWPRTIFDQLMRFGYLEPAAVDDERYRLSALGQRAADVYADYDLRQRTTHAVRNLKRSTARLKAFDKAHPGVQAS